MEREVSLLEFINLRRLLAMPPCLVFSISQNDRDSELRSSFVKFLYCGTVRKQAKVYAVELTVTRFSDLENKIIPFFKTKIYPYLESNNGILRIFV